MGSDMLWDTMSCSTRLPCTVDNNENIGTRISSSLNDNKIDNREHIKLILLTLRLSSQQELDFHEKTDKGSNFASTLETLIEDMDKSYGSHKNKLELSPSM